jgi:hypothetical protein
MEATVAKDLPGETDERRARIWALAMKLKGHGYDPEMDESEPLLTVPSNFDPPVTLRCDARAADSGTLWFYFAPGEPIAPADDAHLVDAIVAVKGRVRVRM